MRQTTRVLLLMVISAFFVGPLSAQSPSPSPTPPSGEEKLKWFEPPDAPPPVTTKVGRIPPPNYTRSLGTVPTAGPLKGMQALETKEGEARLKVQGTEKTVRPGDVLGSDIVKSVSPGQMVLLRPAAADPKLGGAIVIVRFDAKGNPRVLVISEKNPTEPPSMPSPPPQPENLAQPFAEPSRLAPKPSPSLPKPTPIPSIEESTR